jgi:triosephosphate isomerase
VQFGVQNVHWEQSGAFTGETSAEMAASAGARYVLVGHSERRQLFAETDAEVARKTQAVLRAGLIPVVCVGETLEERRAGEAARVVARQLGSVLDAVRQAPEIMIAYEPVWAIGTGETASPEDAQAMHAAIRPQLAQVRSGTVPILYGGSVKPENAATLLAQPDVDGVLVGGASVDPQSFAGICAAAA